MTQQPGRRIADHPQPVCPRAMHRRKNRCHGQAPRNFRSLRPRRTRTGTEDTLRLYHNLGPAPLHAPKRGSAALHSSAADPVAQPFARFPPPGAFASRIEVHANAPHKKTERSDRFARPRTAPFKERNRIAARFVGIHRDRLRLPHTRSFSRHRKQKKRSSPIAFW